MRLDDDLDQLVRDAKKSGRGRLTAAGYLRLNLLSDSVRGWLLVVVPMPDDADVLKREMHRNRDVVITTTVLFLKQAMNRAGVPGDFGEVHQQVEDGRVAFTYRWVPDPVLERGEVS